MSAEDGRCPAIEGDALCGTPRPCPVHMPYRWLALQEQLERDTATGEQP